MRVGGCRSSIHRPGPDVDGGDGRAVGGLGEQEVVKTVGERPPLVTQAFGQEATGAPAYGTGTAFSGLLAYWIQQRILMLGASGQRDRPALNEAVRALWSLTWALPALGAGRQAPQGVSLLRRLCVVSLSW